MFGPCKILKRFEEPGLRPRCCAAGWVQRNVRGLEGEHLAMQTVLSLAPFLEARSWKSSAGSTLFYTTVAYHFQNGPFSCPFGMLMESHGFFPSLCRSHFLVRAHDSDGCCVADLADQLRLGDQLTYCRYVLKPRGEHQPKSTKAS